MSYYVNERKAQKENNMKIDSNYRNLQRSDYEQFAKFLKGSQIGRKDEIQGSNNDTSCHKNRPIAMVYGEDQEWKGLFDLELGLNKGTIFEELDLPLTSTRCAKGGCMGW